MHTPSDPQIITYEIDGRDRIIAVNDTWNQFADANHATELVNLALQGRSLWEFIVDRDTRAIYAMLVAKTRATQQPVRFTYRCDTPEQRRLLRLELYPQDAGAITFTSSVLQVEDRPPVALLDPRTQRDDRFLTICSWCKQVELTDPVTGAVEWVEVEEAVERLGLFEASIMPQLTHGICPSCLTTYRREIADALVTLTDTPPPDAT